MGKSMEKVIQRLQGAIQIPTCSQSDPANTDWTAFAEFINYLEKSYPEVHKQLERTIVNNYGLVFHWRGQGTENESLPILMTAHYDVVAAPEDGWKHPPFSAYDDGENIWGRGCLDDKSSLICIMEAIDQLLADHFQPPHDLYFAFGFDEEQGGRLGAQKIAAYFKEKQIHFKYVLDEGGAIVEGATLGVDPDLAVIGIAEKGNNSFRFTFQGDEGHSSAPPDHTAVGKMAAFIQTVENHPLPIRLTDTVIAMLKTLAPYKGGIAGKALANPKLFAPVIQKILLKNRQTAAMLRTTVAFTMTSGGSGHNVLPKDASCVANVRILQGDSIASVKEYFAGLGFDYQMEPLLENEPTAASDLDSEGMVHLANSIRAVFDQTLPLPYLMVGGTDCRYYNEVSDNAFRFLPSRLTAEELATMHATNERISHKNLFAMVKFYRHFLESLVELED